MFVISVATAGIEIGDIGCMKQREVAAIVILLIVWLTAELGSPEDCSDPFFNKIVCLLVSLNLTTTTMRMNWKPAYC